MYKFVKDKYHKSRGGTSRVLEITCEHCKNHVTYYQKDGPGILKRLYVDRFIDTKPVGNTLTCLVCSSELGILFNYKKEDRPAYRLFVGSVAKKIASSTTLQV
jgi:peptide methionine sulfoxide reductase MsrB